VNEQDLREGLNQDPFAPVRIHLVSGKTIDVLRPGAAWTLKRRLLIFRNPAALGTSAEGYDVIAYENIERIEQLNVGKRSTQKRRPA
jgi:hypothetical protein